MGCLIVIEIFCQIVVKLDVRGEAYAVSARVQHFSAFIKSLLTYSNKGFLTLKATPPGISWWSGF